MRDDGLTENGLEGAPEQRAVVLEVGDNYTNARGRIRHSLLVLVQANSLYHAISVSIYDYWLADR